MNFAVIGDPIGHSLSPDLHNWVFSHLGLDANYTKLRVTDEKLADVIDKLNNGSLDGINVTIPHKENIIRYLDDVNIKAKHINAVNCVIKHDEKLVGYNTDWYGFTMTLRENSINVENRTCVILGAGGAAKSILYSLIRQGAKSIRIANRHKDRALELISQMAFEGDTTKLKAIIPNDIEHYIDDTSIIINCTPLGMTPDTNISPLPESLISSQQILIDTIYTPLETLFLKLGNAAGAQTVGGLDMFIYQALASIDLWFGESISKKVDINKLKNYLKLQL